MLNPKAPILRGQPKTHKENVPIRPVINYRNAPTFKICKYLNTKVQNSLVWEKDYSIKNCYDLIDKIKEIQIPEDTIFLSFDVNNMYANIPKHETLQILEKDLKNSNTLTKNEIIDIMKLSKVTIEQNYFEFNKCFYEQIDGLPMGSPFSGLLANIYMHNLEINNILNENNPFKDKIIYWYRYMDDVICLFKGNTSDSENFLKYLNSLSNRISFTKEEQKRSINFLDITITNKCNNHTFKIFHKPAQSDLIIPQNSNHPWNQKMSTFHSMINRLIRIPMNKHDYENELKRIKYLATRNGYKIKTIENIVRRARVKNNKKKINVENKEFICLPYNSTMTRAFRNTFKKDKFYVSYKTTNNAFNMINKFSNNTNQNGDKFNKSGIYKIKCSDCDSFYVGQTGRSFRTRYREHIQALKSQNLTSMKSTFAEHIMQSNHKYTNIDQNMEVLDYEIKGNKMNCKEDFYIFLNYKTNPNSVLNTTHTTTNNPIFDKLYSIKTNSY